MFLELGYLCALAAGCLLLGLLVLVGGGFWLRYRKARRQGLYYALACPVILLLAGGGALATYRLAVAPLIDVGTPG